MHWLSGRFFVVTVAAMKQPKKAIRLTALKRAHSIRAERLARAIEREQAIETALAGVFEHHDRAEAALAAARQRADQILADGNTQAEQHREAARDSIRALHALGETRAAIADLTRLPVHIVRNALADNVQAPPTQLNTPHCA
ncbi:hypothetical protein Pen01_40410 [Phytomonospora endophytica]|nr:hypothetical protein Pen01_40410 [Phytomonospora endophytica]